VVAAVQRARELLTDELRHRACRPGMRVGSGTCRRTTAWRFLRAAHRTPSAQPALHFRIWHCSRAGVIGGSRRRSVREAAPE
jgi:hypothetical protein